MDGGQELLEKVQTQQVCFVPLGLKLDHRLQGFGRKGVARMVKGNRDSSSIGVMVPLMAAALRAQKKPISDESRDEFSGAELAQPVVVDRHTLDRDHYMRLGVYLNLVLRRVGDGVAVFEEFRDHHLHHLLNMAVGFLLGIAPGSRPIFLECRTIGVPAVVIWLHHYFEIVGFHRSYSPGNPHRFSSDRERIEAPRLFWNIGCHIRCSKASNDLCPLPANRSRREPS